ncbi:hypothetical protein ABZ468_27535 [Streptomyces sp. NPDC005708]|uniref:hypothetical protein n=1 Tax=unclassified Streptomyces TaxID=2593676 RepID=UPI0033CB04B5
MLALFLLLILAAVALGFIGVLMKGLFYLLIIGVVVFVANLLLMGTHWSRRWHHHHIR